jgi:hypothetical protein
MIDEVTMRIQLDNIAKINNANIEINGITVIAGANNTGKSTIGKTLFSLFNGLFNIKHKINNDKISAVTRYLRNAVGFIDIPGSTILSRAFREPFENVNLYELSKTIINSNLDSAALSEILKTKYFNVIQPDEDINEADLEIMCSRINNIINISPIESTNLILKRYFYNEFNGQINNVFNSESGSISLEIKRNLIQLGVDDNEIYLKNDLLFNITDEIVYIDDPFLLDELNLSSVHSSYRRVSYNHRTHLLRQLQSHSEDNVIEELINQGRLKGIYEEMNMICPGYLTSNHNSVEYTVDGFSLNVKNLSAGLKTFTILKELIIKNVIKQNGTIILDEPEIHLHPAWQLVLAKLIVLLQIEFDLHILLTTHSPYFLNAIETYADKYDVKDKIKYYLSEELENRVTFYDVTNNIEKIYLLLAKPLQVLEDMRYE